MNGYYAFGIIQSDGTVIDGDDIGGSSGLLDLTQTTVHDQALIFGDVTPNSNDDTLKLIDFKSTTTWGGGAYPSFTVTMPTGLIQTQGRWGEGSLQLGDANGAVVSHSYGTGIKFRSHAADVLTIGKVGQWGTGVFIPNAHRNNYFGFSGTNAVQIHPESAGVLSVTKGDGSTLGTVQAAAVTNGTSGLTTLGNATGGVSVPGGVLSDSGDLVHFGSRYSQSWIKSIDSNHLYIGTSGNSQLGFISNNNVRAEVTSTALRPRGTMDLGASIYVWENAYIKSITNPDTALTLGDVTHGVSVPGPALFSGDLLAARFCPVGGDVYGNGISVDPNHFSSLKHSAHRHFFTAHHVGDLNGHMHGFEFELTPSRSIGIGLTIHKIKAKISGGDLATLENTLGTELGRFLTCKDVNEEKFYINADGSLEAPAGVRIKSDLELTDETKNIIIKSPNGTRYKLVASNMGTLTLAVA